MRKKILFILFFSSSILLQAQVGVGTSSPDGSAALDVSSTSQGFLPPRMTALQRNSITNPAAGLVLWCTDCGSNGELQVYNGTEFTNVTGGTRERTDQTRLGSDILGEAASDGLGRAIALSNDGQILVAGSESNDGNGSSAGHARVFQYSSSVGWTQLGNDIDGDAAGDCLGRSVAISHNGSIIALGAPENDDNGTDAGQVQVYQYVSGSWTQLGSSLEGESAGDQFGQSVALSSDGTILAVGAPYNDGTGSDAGHVRVFAYSSGSWSQLGSDVDGEFSGDYFGWSIDLSSNGENLVIGAPLNNSNYGHFRVYNYLNNSWTQVGTDIDGSLQNGYFGYSISISNDGNTVISGLLRQFNNGSSQVKVYTLSNGSWTQKGSSLSSIQDQEYFGESVSISGDGSLVAVGAYDNDGTTSNSVGRAVLYKYSNSDWVQIFGTITGVVAGDRLGETVVISPNGEVLSIGILGLDDGSSSNVGGVRVFTDLETSGL